MITVFRGVFRGAMRAWISGGFQALTGAEPPPWKEKKLKAPPGQLPKYAPDHIKGTVSVGLGDPPFKDDNARFTTVSLKPLSD